MERKKKKENTGMIGINANNVSPNPNGNLSILSCVHAYSYSVFLPSVHYDGIRSRAEQGAT